ncbi:MAG: DUF3566 domain-containing protein [Actinomycetota bacterium]
MASREHGREERSEAKPGRSAPAPAASNPDQAFLDALSDPESDDRGASAASRRLRELRSKAGGRSPDAPAPSDPPPRQGSNPRRSTFEVLDQPLPSERAGLPDTLETPRVPDPRTPQGTPEGPPRPLGTPARPTEQQRRTRRTRRRARPPRARPARGAVRRVKRTVKRVDPWSVLKMSLFYYTIIFIVWMIGVALLFSFIESTGVFQTIEEVGDGIEVEQLANFEISLGTVMRWAAYIGGGLVLLATLVNVILAFLYNLGSDIVGGVEMTFVERDE